MISSDVFRVFVPLLPVYLILVSLAGCRESASSDPAPLSGTLYVTSPDRSRLLEPRKVEEVSRPAPEGIPIRIDPHITYQKMDGFGYTLTGGSALHLQKMSEPARDSVLQELFGIENNGLGISYLRISIGASDLDEFPWSYNDLPTGESDRDLKQFSLAYDTLYLIPTLQQILKIAPRLKIMGSPWSPPVWMKDVNDTRGGSLKKEYFPVYAQYFVKYIRGMEKMGIPIDAITIQNEPLHPGNNPSMLMLADDQALFIKNDLGPAFLKEGISTRIVVYDHNADRPDYPISILNDPAAARYIDGSAFHLYGGSIDALAKVKEAHPEKNLYFTEQWIGAPGDFAGDLSWHIENLIIGASRNWCKIVLEWNLAADDKLQPHTDRGGCDRCLGAITIQGDRVVRNPAYYIIAHASRFVPPGSVRIASEMHDSLPNVAFRTPQNKISVIFLNKYKKKALVHMRYEDRQLDCTLGSGEVGTLVFEPEF